MTSKSITIPTTINASMSIEELFQALMAMSSNVTPDTVLDAIEKLQASDQTDRLGLICIQSAAVIKGVSEKVIAATGITLADEWKVGTSVNFSMIAMTGHMIYLLEDKDLTKHGRKGRAIYSKSLGGARNLTDFGISGTVPGKTKRTTILREWSDRLSSTDLERARDVLSAKFPFLVKRRGFAAPAASPAASGFPSILGIVWTFLSIPLRLARMIGTLNLLMVLAVLPVTRPRIFALGEWTTRAATASAIATARATLPVPVFQAAEASAVLSAAAHEMATEAFPALKTAEEVAARTYGRISTGDYLAILLGMRDSTVSAFRAVVEAVTDAAADMDTVEAPAQVPSKATDSVEDREREEASSPLASFPSDLGTGEKSVSRTPPMMPKGSLVPSPDFSDIRTGLAEAIDHNELVWGDSLRVADVKEDPVPASPACNVGEMVVVAGRTYRMNEECRRVLVPRGVTVPGESEEL
jgi:hypothetical protein